MALRFLEPRVPQITPPPDIPYSSTLTDDDDDGLATASQTPNIVVASGLPTISSSSTSPPPTSTTVPASSTPTPSSSAHSGTSVGKVAAIVVPIVALILIIPLIFLLYRSHQLKKAADRRRSQRSSQEAMLQRQSSIARDTATQIAPMQQLKSGKPREGGTRGVTPRPTNSLGLFNFDLSPSPTPRTSTPMSPRTPHELSVAHAMPVRRSQASIINGRQPSIKHSSKHSSNWSQPSMLPADAPQPCAISRKPSNPHFAPLNRIGTAHTRNNSRPNLQRNPSDISAVSRPSHETSRTPAAYGRVYNPSPSNEYLPPIPRGGLNWGERFTISDYHRDGSNDRHSGISAMSDDDEHNRRISQQSHIISPVHDNGGIQPFRIL